ncbi:Multidrug resistance protein MexA [Sphingopyxis fribergensis]|uniref:Multidrug resistance protein MexA n=2 Tax=Sphingomonadaceae TaxID=41297 RepID=A0A0A7PB85_9SPHN|nr:efflux RND transporter periplasmic adaptor subunit [Sphingopyxis fribergensis]AJA07225.1 Multidrug resistance protein MexA [Sphingopyxis fribergensis]
MFRWNAEKKAVSRLPAITRSHPGGGRSRRGEAIIAASLLMTLSACGADEPQGTANAAPEVVVLKVKSEAVSLATALPGRTNPYLVAEVRPQVGGILLRRLFEEGSNVRAGQPLYQINPAPFRATLASAQATLTSSQLLSKRYDRLIKSEAISQQERDDARAKYLAAKAAVDAARIDLEFTRITAPISGRIGRSTFTQGALVTGNQAQPLATVQQLDPIFVDIVQPSTALLKLRGDLASGRLVRSGDNQAKVSLKLENGKVYDHLGTLKFSEVSVDTGTGAVTLRAIFPNPDGILLPGMFVHAELQQGVRQGALLVPQRGIARDAAGQASALVVGSDNKAQQRKITVEQSIGSRSLVSSGLRPGDRVIVDGGQNVKPGAPVKVVKTLS